MPDQPYTTREGWFSGGDEGWLVLDGHWTHLRTSVPALVVTGDLDVVRRRLDQPAVTADTRTRAIATARATWGNRLHWIVQDTIDRVVSDLAAAGLLRTAPTDAAIERAARALNDLDERRAWDDLNERVRDEFRRIARVALAAAEENTDG